MEQMEQMEQMVQMVQVVPPHFGGNPISIPFHPG